MIACSKDIKIHLHREPVDFRKAINGLSVIVKDEIALSPFETGFAVWQKRREADKFKWPRQRPDDPLHRLRQNEQMRGLLGTQDWRKSRKNLFNQSNMTY
ncbi:transposase [Aestuariicella hydrocarbonica]|uniref:Transposase n=1 Tax=Pseudomaricurvus hydrocarbonicus TaxID=1470433 RepID=A0A9E5T3W3_9GAMM|nr:transposase [Aestuariicella hydrocarbonica]NHO67339.1 transposase [Aestuariicella hydrocarbonica]